MRMAPADAVQEQEQEQELTADCLRFRGERPGAQESLLRISPSLSEPLALLRAQYALYGIATADNGNGDASDEVEEKEELSVVQ